MYKNGLIIDRIELGVRRQNRGTGILHLRAGQPIQLLVHIGGDTHGIGVAFLVNRQFNRLVATHAHDAFAFLVTLTYLGDVLQMHRHAVVDLDQQVAHLVERAELIHCAHEIALRAAFDAPAGNVDVFIRETFDDIGRIESDLLQALLVDIDIDLIFQTTTDLDSGDTGRRFEALLQFVIGKTAQLLQFRFANFIALRACGTQR